MLDMGLLRSLQVGEKRTKRQKTPAGIYTKQSVKTLPKKEIEQIWKYNIILGNLPKKEITIKGNNSYVSICIYIYELMVWLQTKAEASQGQISSASQAIPIASSPEGQGERAYP